MRFLRNILGLTLAGLLVSCIMDEQAGLPPISGGVEKPISNTEDTNNVNITRSDKEYYEMKVQDLEEKLRRLSQYDDKKKDSRGECEGDRDCEEICDDIFDRRRDREDCEELNIATVERFDEVYKLLEDPDEDDLSDINPEDLDALISISIEPLDDLVGGYSSREAKEVAAWIAENSDVAEVFESEDDDFELFEAIFGEIGGGRSNAFEGLEKSITGRDSFVDILVQDNNIEAFEWVQNYFEDECSSKSQDEELCVLSRWCHLDFDNDTEEELLDTEEFEDLLNDLIDQATEGDLEKYTTTDSDYELDVCPVTDEFIGNVCEDSNDDADGEANSSDLVNEFFNPGEINKGATCGTDHDDIGCVSADENNYWENIEDARDLPDDWKDVLCK